MRGDVLWEGRKSAKMQTPGSVLIVGNWHQRRQSLYALLRRLPEISRIQLSDYHNAWRCIVDLQPALVIFDHWFPGENVQEISVALRRRYPHIRCIELGGSQSLRSTANASQPDLTLEGDVPIETILDGVRRLLRADPDDGENPEGQPSPL
ncbi:MAG: response regulator transcription factor [Anaerolineae bacterium]|nr:response regulator transcription factor [Anaerolineae bacterium]